MVDTELLRRLEYLSLVARRVPGGGLLGYRPSRLPAGGTELTGRRDYSPGDDYRQVDWGICARHDELRTRQFQGEQDLHVYLLLDCSRSMGLGRWAKFDVARRIAAALAYVALAEGRRVAVAAFTGRIVAECPPIRGKSRILKLIRFLDRLSFEDGPTHLAQAAAQFVARYQRHGPAVVISDLLDSNPAAGGGFRAGLDVLRSRGYSPRVVQLCDPAEARPETLGDVELFDVETQTTRQVTVTERDFERYIEVVRQFDESVRAYCAKYRIHRARISCDLPEDEFLLRAIGARVT